MQHAVFGYVRGQLLFSVAMGAGAGVALWIFGLVGVFPDGKTYALFFGAFFGLMELVPYVGPILGAIPPILVALFQDPLTAVWVAILFVALQQLEGHVVAPLVFGQALRINPLLVIFALALGAEVCGDHRRAAGPAAAGDRARDRRLPARPPRARAVGNGEPGGGPRGTRGPAGPLRRHRARARCARGASTPDEPEVAARK